MEHLKRPKPQGFYIKGATKSRCHKPPQDDVWRMVFTLGTELLNSNTACTLMSTSPQKALGVFKSRDVTPDCTDKSVAIRLGQSVALPFLSDRDLEDNVECIGG